MQRPELIKVSTRSFFHIWMFLGFAGCQGASQSSSSVLDGNDSSYPQSETIYFNFGNVRNASGDVSLRNARPNLDIAGFIFINASKVVADKPVSLSSVRATSGNKLVYNPGETLRISLKAYETRLVLFDSEQLLNSRVDLLRFRINDGAASIDMRAIHCGNPCDLNSGSGFSVGN